MVAVESWTHNFVTMVQTMALITASAQVDVARFEIRVSIPEETTGYGQQFVLCYNLFKVAQGCT
jgi:hypothetical protein